MYQNSVTYLLWEQIKETLKFILKYLKKNFLGLVHSAPRPLRKKKFIYIYIYMYQKNRQKRMRCWTQIKLFAIVGYSLPLGT